jgi:hypothetical protein
LVKSKKTKQIPLKEDDQDKTEEIAMKVKDATKRKENAKTNEEKLDAAVALDEAKSLLKMVRCSKCIVSVIARK